MQARDAKKEAAPSAPNSLLTKLEGAHANGRKKRNFRQRETTDYKGSDEVQESKWHNCIEGGKWELVLDLLDALRNGSNTTCAKGQEKSKSMKKKKRPSISWLWKGTGKSPSLDNEETQHVLDRNSLLITNSAGRTPLVTALNEEEIPDQIILEILAAQSKAVSIPDRKGRMPLHFAVGRQKKIDVMAELVELYPQAMSHEDEQGRTPLAYAMDVAKQQTDLDDAPASFWASQEKNSHGGKWQERQIKLWEVSRWLLLSSASHRESHLTMNNGQPLLIEALLHAAPPTVISLLIAASSPFLSSGEQATSFCCSAMYLCIFRRYPLFVLRQLGAFCPADVRFVRDKTGLGLVSAQYVTSCFEKSKLREYVAAEDFTGTLENCIIEGKMTSDDSLFLEWWSKLKFLLFFCAEKDPDVTSENHLLHAALMNADTPPNVIRLLLALYPDSARQVDPCSAHPLHLYCMHREYIPRNYESPYIHGLNVIDMLLSLDESAIFHRLNGRLPIHLAIAAGRTWSTLHPLVSSNKLSLREPDPISHLYPALLAATYQEAPSVETTHLLQLTQSQYSSIVWTGLSENQQQEAVARMRQTESLRRLETIFELLRRYPQCIETAMVSGEDSNTRSDHAGAGIIASHYLAWCYEKINGEWKRNHENMSVLRTNSRTLRVRGMLGKRTKEFVEWLRLLKMYIWHSYSVATSPRSEDALFHTIPRDDNFLLHAAVSRSSTPPNVVQLLIGLFPQSAFLVLPNTQTLPLHLACKTPTYIPRFFEDNDRHNSIDLLLRETPEKVLMRSEDGRMPLHLAIDAGKTIEDLRELIRQGPIALTVLDPVDRLYPFQMMALDRKSSPEKLSRFKDLAQNKHAEARDKISPEDQENFVKITHHEHEVAVLSSIFELLRLNVSVLEVSSERERPSAESMEIVLEAPLYGNDKWASYHDREERKQSQLRRLLSGLSGVSLCDDVRSDASAFSGIDVVSAISNVSSHLSFRRRKPFGGPGSGRMVSGRPLNDERSRSESEDSDIYSEAEISIDDDYLKEHDTGEVRPSDYGDDKDWKSSYASAASTPPNRYLGNTPLSRKFPGFACPDIEAGKRTQEDQDTIAQEISDPAQNYIDSIGLVAIDKEHNCIRDGSRIDESNLTGSVSDSGGSKDQVTPLNITHSGNISPGVRCLGEQGTSYDSVRSQNETLERKSTQSCKLSNRDSQYRESLSSLRAFDDSLNFTEILRNASKSNNDDSNSDDGSIQDDLVKEQETENALKLEEEDVVFFRLRRSSYRQPGGPKLRRKKLTGVSHNDSSVEMDFLSILHASLPEGGMDYLSILERSSASLPLTHGSLPPGCFDFMQQIEELPSESEHGKNTVSPHAENKGQVKTTAHSKRSTTDEPPHASSRSSTESSFAGQINERRNKHDRKGSSNEGKGTDLTQLQRNRSSLKLSESEPIDLQSSGGSTLIQWRRVKHEGKVPSDEPSSNFRRVEDSIGWQRNIHAPKRPPGPPSSRVGKVTSQIEWRRNNNAHGGSHPFITKSGFTSEQITASSRAPQSLLSALETRQNSLEISYMASSYMAVKPQKLKSCLQCGLRERGVLMLPCTHLCLCRECSADIDQISSCPICMNPVIDKMVVL